MLQNSTNNRNLGIDFLRAISISFVVLLHLNIHLQLSASPLNEILSRRAFLVLFWSGYYGVVIFFTLSGYLITTNIFRRWELPSTIDLRTYCEKDLLVHNQDHYRMDKLQIKHFLLHQFLSIEHYVSSRILIW